MEVGAGLGLAGEAGRLKTAGSRRKPLRLRIGCGTAGNLPAVLPSTVAISAVVTDVRRSSHAYGSVG